jgi:FkbM family methyltransferase
MELATVNLNLGHVERKFLYRKDTNDEGVIAHALKNSAYDLGRLRRAKEIFDLYDRLVRADKAPLIIDAAANIGASTVYFALAFPKARLVAIEPEQRNFDLLAANTADLSVECLHAVVAASNGVSNVADPGNLGCQTAAPDDSTNAAHSFAGVSINEIYERNEHNTLPFIVKIDIERCGGEMFAANPEWVDRTPIIIIQLNDCLIPGTDNSRAFVEYSTGRNRDFVYLYDNIFSITREIKSN